MNTTPEDDCDYYKILDALQQNSASEEGLLRQFGIPLNSRTCNSSFARLLAGNVSGCSPDSLAKWCSCRVQIPSKCRDKIDTSCSGARRAGLGNCFNCVAQHQHTLKEAGCDENDTLHYCNENPNHPDGQLDPDPPWCVERNNNPVGNNPSQNTCGSDQKEQLYGACEEHLGFKGLEFNKTNSVGNCMYGDTNIAAGIVRAPECYPATGPGNVPWCAVTNELMYVCPSVDAESIRKSLNCVGETPLPSYCNH